MSKGSLNHDQKVHLETLAASSADGADSTGTCWNASISGMENSPLHTRMTMYEAKAIRRQRRTTVSPPKSERATR